MKRAISMISMLMLIPAFLIAQQKVAENPETKAIIQTALDYADGYYNGEPERMERAIHPDFNKVSLMKLPNSENVFINYSSWSGLIAACKSKSGYLEPEKRMLEVSVLAIDGKFACAKLTSAQFNDYLGLYKHEGQWKIYTVLWAPGPDSRFKGESVACDSETVQEDIKHALKQAIEGVYTGDLKPVKEVVHPESARITPLVSRKTGEFFVYKDGASVIYEVVKAKLSVQDKEKWVYELEVMDCMDDMAFVKITSPQGNSYVQLAMIEDQWMILNTLRQLPPPPPPEK